MPVYEYQCPKCGKEQDRWFKISEKPQEFEDKCDECGDVVMLKAILSPTGIHGFQYSQYGDK